MRRSRLLCLILIVLLLDVIALADDSSQRSREVEIRGVWIDRGSIPKTEQGIRNLIRDYARAGINVVFPEVIFNGYSAYPSSYLTQKDLWNGLPFLDILIDEAHRVGIEVHPWVWVFRVGNVNDQGGILSRYPDWVAVGKDGKPISDKGGYWLCPSLPQARHLLLRAITELVHKYPVDGVHLDYIRFDYQDPVPKCYNESCRRRFMEACGVDPQDIEPLTEAWMKWHMWREELVNTFVCEASKAVKAIRPEIKVSAAVMPGPERARLTVLQNWKHWAANGWIDFVLPMAYTASTSGFEGMVNKDVNNIGTISFLAPGVGLFYLQKEPAKMVEQIEASRRAHAAGVTLFASAYLDKRHIEALASGPFRKRAILPFRDPEASARKLLADAGGRLSKANSTAELSDISNEVGQAKHIVDYLLYRTSLTSEVKATPPDVFIPDVVLPIPRIEVPKLSYAPKVDGCLEEGAWESAARTSINFTAYGKEVTQPTEVMVGYDANNMYIAFRCAKSKLNAARVSALSHDGPVFQDDSVEVFLGMGGNDNYAHFAVNVAGTTYDAKGYDTSWNPEWSVAVRRGEGEWTVEIAIPWAVLGEFRQSQSLSANFCRNRVLIYKEAENMAWSATYGSFHTPKRFGVLSFSN